MHRIPRRVALWVGVAMVVSTVSAPLGAAPASADVTSTVVHLGHGTDDLHAVTMGLGIATVLAKRPESKVTLFLDREGVRVADRRTRGDLRWGHSKTLAELYDAFVAAGGEVLVCSHCAEAGALAAEQLRAGARIGSDDEVAARLLAADRILDY
jgi:predicted peroxiredoxin